MIKICINTILMLICSLHALGCKNEYVISSKQPAASEKPQKQQLPQAFYSFTSATSSYFNIYQKLSEKDSLYTQFKVYHQHSTVRNDNLWRLSDGNLVKYNGSAMVPIQQILTVGENEFVWKSGRPNVGDFTGGYHGDERIDIDPASKVTFYVDGKAILPVANIPLTPCSSFYYHQFSTMHQSGTGAADMSKAEFTAIPGNPIDCYHEKKTIFENSGFTTYNKLTWATQVPVNTCYYGILCVNKDISFEGINEDGERAVFNNDGKNKLTSQKQKINMKNDVLGISVSCDAEIISVPFVPNLTTFIWDHKNYHKYYSGIKATSASPGDVWETKASISFLYTK